MACWEIRGCDEEMQSRCPHCTGDDMCPSDCFNTYCDRPTHQVVEDVLLLLNPDRDYDIAPKEICHSCLFFVEHGPSRKDRLPDQKTYGGARFLI